MQLASAGASGSPAAGACPPEIDAATKLAMKNTSDMAIITSISILDLLLVALTE
jgi:hypothetical protein